MPVVSSPALKPKIMYVQANWDNAVNVALLQSQMQRNGYFFFRTPWYKPNTIEVNAMWIAAMCGMQLIDVIVLEMPEISYTVFAQYIREFQSIGLKVIVALDQKSRQHGAESAIQIPISASDLAMNIHYLFTN